MGLITSGHIVNLKNELEQRSCGLFHACQYADFCSYMYLQALPSRKVLSNWPHTPFRTDAQDKQNEVWDQVFLNLGDFGNVFACGGRATPNPYGPVLIEFEPSILMGAESVCVSLSSAASDGFDRESESLDVRQIPDLFQSSEYHRPNSRFLKTTTDLKEHFGLGYAQSPEISVEYPKNRVECLKHIRRIIVDPYCLGGTGLTDLVSGIAEKNDVREAVKARGLFKKKRDAVLLELGELIWKRRPPFTDAATIVTEDEDCSKPTKEYLSSLTPGAQRTFNDFATYLAKGTLPYLGE